MSELRDRIANVINDYVADNYPEVNYAGLADAVIADLGLFMEYENGRVLYKKKPTSTNFRLWQQRIASEFEPYTG